MFFPEATALLLSVVLAFSWLDTNKLDAANLPQDEVNILNQIARTMGNSDWNFDADVCNVTENVDRGTGSEKNITCTCQNGTCHVTHIIFKLQSLPGVLPTELVNLPHLKVIDFAYNDLSGSIPPEWASMQLEFISVFGNRLSGNIPTYLGNISSLTYLDLEANQFSGEVPPEIGKLVNLRTLRLSSNRLSGNLPVQLSQLKNLTDFRINDNNFNGSIPDFIQNWKNLQRLEMQASGLEGPIPSSISALRNLITLIISDINGTNQPFPDFWNMTGINRIVLKKCNIIGQIPQEIWQLSKLHVFFNSLSGELIKVTLPRDLKFLYLTGNKLSGNIPASMLQTGLALDLSYNNFTWQSPEQPACTRKLDNINLFRSSSAEYLRRGVIPCTSDFKCQKYWHSMYINCGGDNDVKINGTMYVGDAKSGLGGAATLYWNNENWGFSSTGDFRDDNDELNAASRYLKQSASMTNQLYATARLSPLSLTYYRYCLENGSYTVRLHFAEIEITNNTRYARLGRRIFNIYIQDELVEEDFNIEAEAGGPLTPLTKHYNVNVTNGEIEIRFYWAGKGTQAIPSRGVHGALISAMSLDPNFKPQHAEKKTKTLPIVVGVLGSFLVFLVSGVLCWRYYFKTKSQREKDLEGLDLQTVSFTLKQIKAATNNFDSVNKIGEGGFGPVYKGQLADGTIIAVKQLSSKSSQGNREFLNEMGIFSCLQHPNLVKLYGCCIEGNQLLLVYEYMENNSLSRALFGPEYSRINLEWPTRHKICVGIARGLAFLHEESRLKIVHRDIKATNVLLDRDLNPKISDFGLAKLHEEEKTHISTRIAGTIGYIAPEYALWGYLTYKADVYSFGIVALELVSGKRNLNYGPGDKHTCLLDWACHLQQSGKLLELVDDKLGSEYNKSEAEGMIKVALLCTNASPSLRPTMSQVVEMLEGTITIPDAVPNASSYSEDLRFKAIRDHRSSIYSQTFGESQGPSTTYSGSQFESSSTSALTITDANEES
ncbi:probable LRR receptor-like serine/threonine-protein kinase RFK1 isoform X2 [Herrania umbratica]|uniref:non-specific serine/threonine protein kinase n=1 Tax=Herrania umbratica TaxID=108875 RepID=A0A6J1B3R2_9ROSI|nr:probable LRR receptor-like serine/threonine-protein kinase RFK1 isoform X2 [Herrania umbratica]